VAAAARCMCDSETAPFVHAAAVSGPDSDGEQGPTGAAGPPRGAAAARSFFLTPRDVLKRSRGNYNYPVADDDDANGIEGSTARKSRQKTRTRRW
jgi:hypothetical protein